MARIGFKSENRSTQGQKHPKLKLEKDERARVVLMEEDPWSEYIHNLRMPRVDSGNVLMVQRTRNDGTVFETYDTEWVSTLICLGDSDTLATSGTDPANCPMCAEAVKGSQVAAPTRKFATNLVRYVTKAGTYDIQNPFRVEVIAWTFSDGVFNQLLELKTEHGDLRKKDLLLRCKVQKFQQYDIQPGSDAAWLKEENRNIVIETFNENKLDDDVLSSLCGRRQTPNFVKADLNKIRDRWAEVERIESGSSAAVPDSSVSLDAGLDGLLDDLPAGSAKTEATDLEDLLAPAAAEKEEVLVPSSDDKPGSSGEAINFTDLLDGLE